MFQFPGWPPCTYGFSAGYLDITPGGFPHSEIHGSKDMCSSPWLIAACHVLHRSPVPRHPPCAPTVFLFLAESIQAVDGVKLTIARQLDAIFFRSLVRSGFLGIHRAMRLSRCTRANPQNRILRHTGQDSGDCLRRDTPSWCSLERR